MEKTGKLCLFEGKMLPISNMMKMYQRCQPDVDMLIFFMRPFTENEYKELSGCSLEYEWKYTAKLETLPGKLQWYLMTKRKRKCVLNRGLEPRFPGCISDGYKWAHLISPSQFHSGK